MVKGPLSCRGVTPDEVFDFVLDPAQYTKADTKMVWVTKLADVPDGMLAREDGKFLGLFKGSVVTRYRWTRPTSIDVTLEHGVPRSLHAWFEIDAVEGDAGAPRRGARPRARAARHRCTTPWPARGSRVRSPVRWPRSHGCSRQASAVEGPTTARGRERSPPLTTATPDDGGARRGGAIRRR